MLHDEHREEKQMQVQRASNEPSAGLQARTLGVDSRVWAKTASLMLGPPFLDRSRSLEFSSTPLKSRFREASFWRCDSLIQRSWGAKKGGPSIKLAVLAQTLFLCVDFFWVDTLMYYIYVENNLRRHNTHSPCFMLCFIDAGCHQKGRACFLRSNKTKGKQQNKSSLQ